MQQFAQQCKPLAQQQGIIVEKTQDEVLIYDLERKIAHCLNPLARQVWHHCDGQTTIPQLIQQVQTAMGEPVDRALIILALSELEKANLLQQPVTHFAEAQLSRRAMIRVAGIAATATLVTTILAPTAAEAASPLQAGAKATSSAQCKSGLRKSNGTCL